MSNLFFLLAISTSLLANCFGLNCWMSDEEDGDPIKKQENCLKSHCFVVSCGGMVAHGCGDGVEACEQMKRTCLDATVQSNKVGEFLGQNRDNRCALCQGDLCNTPEKLTAPEKPHKCWKIVASEELREGEGSVPSKIDCGLEAVGCYTINGTGGKISKGCFVNEPAFNLLRKLLDAEIEQTKLCIGDFCNA